MKIAKQYASTDTSATTSPLLTLATFAECIAALLASSARAVHPKTHQRNATKRLLVALVGAPGSGKSTSAKAVGDMLAVEHNIQIQVVQMDGFHYDNALLAQLGLSERKGAPNSFDVAGLENLLQRLTNNHDQDEIVVPVFDRKNDLSRANAQRILQTTQVLLLEGNYLLLNDHPWNKLAKYFSLSAMLVCDTETLRARLTERWLNLGYSTSQAEHKVIHNDLLNAQAVMERSRLADYRIAL